MIDINYLKNGDLFYNTDKTVVGRILFIDDYTVTYEWVGVDEFILPNKVRKIKKSEFKKYAEFFNEMSSLEKELI